MKIYIRTSRKKNDIEYDLNYLTIHGYTFLGTRRYTYIMNKVTNMNSRWIIVILVTFLVLVVKGQDRRPTISFITQPEIVTDIGGTVEMKCSVQVIFSHCIILKYFIE